VRRVVIVGRAGAGKSFVARELAARTGLPVIHLDTIFWAAAWKPVPVAEAVGELERRLVDERWIADGNFLDAGDSRFRRADTVVLLDVPRGTCVWRVVARRIRDRGGRRSDLPAGAYEGFDWALLRWIWKWDRTERPKLLRLLNANPHVDFVVVTDSAAAVDTIAGDA